MRTTLPKRPGESVTSLTAAPKTPPRRTETGYRYRFARDSSAKKRSAPDAGSSESDGDGERAATRARKGRECRADDTNYGDVDERGGGCHALGLHTKRDATRRTIHTTRRTAAD